MLDEPKVQPRSPSPTENRVCGAAEGTHVSCQVNERRKRYVGSERRREHSNTHREKKLKARRTVVERRGKGIEVLVPVSETCPSL